MDDDVALLVLGPIEVRRGTDTISVGGLGARVLCGLLMGVNHAVSIDQLAWAVWGDDPPPSAEASIQTYVYRLRSLLGSNAIVNIDHAYRLEAQCHQIDSCRFERLVAEAESALPSDAARARELAREALGLWRGSPYGDLGAEEFAQLETIRLLELRLDAVELEVDAELRTGHAREAVARLQALAREHPTRERFWHLLIRGLASIDRRPEAVEAFRSYAASLEESGLAPYITLEEMLAP